MKTAKTVISATLALVIALLCFAGCAKLPEDPVTTTAEKYSYVSPYGATAPVPDNQDEHPDATSPQFVETINNVEVVFGSYYVYGKNAAKITSSTSETPAYPTMQTASSTWSCSPWAAARRI